MHKRSGTGGKYGCDTGEDGFVRQKKREILLPLKKNNGRNVTKGEGKRRRNRRGRK